jgi:Ulp1 family protease
VDLEWSSFKEIKLGQPQQNDGVSCAMFSCRFAQVIFEHRAQLLLLLTEQEITNFWEQVKNQMPSDETKVEFKKAMLQKLLTKELNNNL